MSRRTAPSRAVLALAFILTAGPITGRCAEPAAPAWSAFQQQFIEDTFAAHPDFAAVEGRHEFDGHLPDWSAAGLAAEQQRLERARVRAAAYPDAALTARERFERDYLLARVDGDLFWLREARMPFRNPAYYTGSLDPTVYLTRPYAPLPVRMKAFIGYLHAIPAAARQIRANLAMPLPRTFITLGYNSFHGYADFFRKDAPGVFATVADPGLQQQLKEAIEPAAQAMAGLADWMSAEKARATENFALGPRAYADMLWATERVDTPLEQLRAVAARDLARNRAALVAACAAYLPGAGLQACVDKVNADKTPGGAVEGARSQLAGLRQFILDKGIVTIPGDEQALVAEAPPYQRWNFAYIDIAGPYDKGMPSVYNIAPPDPAWPKAEQDAYTPGRTSLLFTSVHEVWPGHFLQFLHANRSRSLFGQIFVGYAFAEGWAHYTEEMMWDAGLGAGAPDVHIGQLLEALMRNVRFTCSLGLHTGDMTVAQCETMFREQALTDPGNARQQAERGTFDPAYLNYTLGKLMIGKLREDWTASHGGRKAWREFHDAFLAYGGPPIPLVRAQMMGKAGGDLF